MNFTRGFRVLALLLVISLPPPRLRPRQPSLDSLSVPAPHWSWTSRAPPFSTPAIPIRRSRIASITKLMTALVVLEAGQSLDEKLEITTADRRLVKGAYSRLAIGRKLTRGQADAARADVFRESRCAGSGAVLQRRSRGVREGDERQSSCARHEECPVRGSGRTLEQQRGERGGPREARAAAAGNPIISEYSTDKEYTVRVGRRQLGFHNTNSLVAKPCVEHRRAEDRLHLMRPAVPGHAGGHRQPHRRHRAAQFLRQVHPRG